MSEDRSTERNDFNHAKGQMVEVRIEDMSQEGQGIGRADGLVVFVPGTVVGDVVRAELTKVKKSYAFSRLAEVVEHSPWRVEFDCESFAEGCGGCPYGRLDYEAQLRVKERQVREKLQRIARIDAPVVRPIIGMQEDDNEGFGPYRYRNKAQFPVSTGGIITRKGGIVENLGEPAVGFYRAKSHEVVDCEDCYLQSMAAMAAADALRTFMEEDHIAAWDPKWDKGLIRHLIVKTAFSTGEVMVILVINGKGIPNGQKLVEMLDEVIYEVGYSLESVILSIKKSDGVGGSDGANGVGGKKSKRRTGQGQISPSIITSGEILGDENIVLAGKSVIRDVVGALEFEISPASFYQVNPVQMKRLYDKVRAYCGFEEGGIGDCGLEKCRCGECRIRGNELETCGFDGEKLEKCSSAGYEFVEDGLEENETDCGGDKVVCAGGAEMDGKPVKKPVILDLYCGVGSIGLYCADQAEMIIGIESVREAVVDANRNAVINGIVNARYLCGRAEDILPMYAGYGRREGGGETFTAGTDEKERADGERIDAELAGLIQRADIAILDPPRAGCRPELLEAVAAVGVKRIVYVSCDPATLARDIKLLGEEGYEFVEATPADLFPMTGHVECVVLMIRKDK